MFGLEGMFGKKTIPAEMGQSEARDNEQVWAAMVAGQKPAEPKMTPEGMIEPEGISPESKARGYEGNTPFKSELTTEQVPVIDASAEAEKNEMLESMRGKIERYFEETSENPGEDDSHEERREAA